jgi:hypothetical protein
VNFFYDQKKKHILKEQPDHDMFMCEWRQEGDGKGNRRGTAEHVTQSEQSNDFVIRNINLNWTQPPVSCTNLDKSLTPVSLYFLSCKVRVGQ